MSVYNPYIFVPFATWAVAQVMKFMIVAVRGKIDFRYLYASGGMPSVHSAVVCALATTTLILEGWTSPVTGITVVLAAIVMYDSLGVRRSVGQQAELLNMVLRSVERGKVRLDVPGARVREALGHDPHEVAVGAILGVALGTLFQLSHFSNSFTAWRVVPQGLELWIYAGVFVALAVIGVAQRLVLKRRWRGSATIKRMTGRLFVALEVGAVAGLILVAFMYENAGYLAWRAWMALWLAVVVVWLGTIVVKGQSAVAEGLAREAVAERKGRWLGPKRKKR